MQQLAWQVQRGGGEGKRGEGNEDTRRTCMALFFWKPWASSIFPIMMMMEEAPPKRASPDRLSAFQALTKWEMRSWKSLLSILMASDIVTARDCRCRRD